MAINFRAYCWMGLLAASLVFAHSAQAAKATIAAIVNDDIITSGDLSDRVALVMALNGLEATDANRQKITPQVLQTLVDEQLELQEAKRQSQNISDEEVDKALQAMAASRGGAPGSLQKFVADKGLSMNSVRSQLSAQLAWNKVVQTKLRRNVSISQDEIARAQTAQATSPGAPELRIAAFSVPIANPSAEVSATAVAQEIIQRLKAGAPAIQLAGEYTNSQRAAFNPPSWVAEESLPAPLQQAMRTLKPGETTPPLRSGSSLQIIQLLDRQTVKKLPDNTEIALKQIAIPVPATRDKSSLATLEATVSALHANPGSCEGNDLPSTPLAAEVKFARTKIGQLNVQQRTIVGHLEVGQVSDPLFGPQAVQLIMLCEKIEPAGNLPDADAMRQQLYSEKLELEAQKLLRDLHRNAFIDIKTDDKI